MAAIRPMIRSVRAAASDGLSVQEVQYDHGVKMGRHAHPELSLTMVLCGALQECVGSKGRAEPAAFAIGVKPFCVEHSNEFAPTGTRLISVTVAKSWYDRLEEHGPALDDWRWVSAGPAVATFLSLLQHLRHDPAAVQHPAGLRAAHGVPGPGGGPARARRAVEDTVARPALALGRDRHRPNRRLRRRRAPRSHWTRSGLALARTTAAARRSLPWRADHDAGTGSGSTSSVARTRFPPALRRIDF